MSVSADYGRHRIVSVACFLTGVRLIMFYIFAFNLYVIINQWYTCDVDEYVKSVKF